MHDLGLFVTAIFIILVGLGLGFIGLKAGEQAEQGETVAAPQTRQKLAITVNEESIGGSE
jgi:hypothetical protein